MVIVTTHYRYKRPPRKRAKAAAIEGPAIVLVEKKGRRGNPETAAQVLGRNARPDGADRRNPSTAANADRKPAIVTIRSRKHAKHADVEDLTEEELQRRADAADALWRDIVRRATSKEP